MDNYTYQHFEMDARERRKKARQHNRHRQANKNKARKDDNR